MNEREDYLDRLLRGIDENSQDGAAEDEFFSGLGGAVSQDAEDDFLKAFEESRSQSSNMSENSTQDFAMEDVNKIVNDVKNGMLDNLDEFGSLEDGGDLPIDESLQNYQSEDKILDGIGSGYNINDSEYEVNTLDEGDQEGNYGSGEPSQELLDMLSGIGEEEPAGSSMAEELPIQDDFSLSEEEGVPGESAGSSFLEEALDFEDPDPAEKPKSAVENLAKELEDLGLDLEEGEVKERKKEKKKKKDPEAGETGEEKQGFFQKFSQLLFGGEELVELSEEEARELDEKESQKAAAKKQEKERKEQEKKEKKEQKKQEKAEKKAQKEKAKLEKPKKEKKPRVIEKTKPLPKLPVFLIMLVGLSLVVLIILLSSQIGYTLSIARAKEYYEQGNYVESYSCFNQGEKVKEVDEELYNKARLTAYLQQPINSYQVYQKRKMHQEALNALIIGVGRYDKNASEAASAGAAVEYDKMLKKVEKALKKKYGMTLEKARELYAIRDKETYTLELYQVIEELGLK